MIDSFKYPDTKAYEYVVAALAAKGVTYKEIAKITYELQQQFLPDIELKEYEEATIDVMHKRELLNNVMVSLYLDKMATEHKLDEPLQSIVAHDAGVFGVDETLALQIANIYGSIGVTNYGHVDRVKPGIIGKLDRDRDSVNTFIDDVVGGIAAAVAGKLAHKYS
ncbi:phosphatidylglycerophosphatase A family protein [Paucilactobacillus kaifaensis]|uniref:phosphatidylglycerophosphatase A family protein n=1 Tax=Paucilactobacillus kaifaensis TaxID=2559921 RepID=UPI0010F71B94|nr:phosphatidylglycerophosphatase A [Paucilactobacillus kaifaensis]